MGALLAGTLGLAVAEWAPFAFMAYLTPVVAFVLAYLFRGRMSGGDDADESSGEEVDEEAVNLA
jgi:Na+/H+ antiporter NhaC